MEFTDVSIENIECSQKIGGNIYSAPSPARAMDFSSCSNILKTPKNMVKAFKKADFTAKPDPDYKKAKLNIARKHGVKCENIALERNTFYLLDVVLKSIKARTATVVMPCEPVYKDICRVNNCDVLPYVLEEVKNFKFNNEDFIESLSGKNDTVILSNPNNATGRAISKSEIKNILDFCLAKGVYVIVDESFIDFVPEGQSVVGLISEYYNLIVIRSLPEYYNVSGVGVAYAISTPEIVENINELQLLWCVDVCGAVLCENAYNSDKFDLKTKKWIFDEKRKFVKKLKTLNNVRVIHSDCHLLLLRLEDTSATTVYNRLLKSNIIIRDASSFNGLDGSYIRISVKSEKENDMFIESLLKCLI